MDYNFYHNEMKGIFMTSYVSEIFGSMVFNDEVMRERLPKDVYKALHKTVEAGKSLDITLANGIANAMKDWAIEKGATHYSHWFQPLTGVTAEKHESFITPCSDGRVIMEFSGKALIKGETDASSFPSGGLRATFEARGYTAWDPTSYAFVKDGTLFIPTVLCSYFGETLDKKTPLLRSMEDINREALRIIRLFGNDTAKHVSITVGAEQEYFLIDKKLYDRREDLLYTGRTLFGAPAPKGQELDDHYYGAIKPRVAAFMKELDDELWKLGIPSKTKHNEVAPAQHELAPVYISANFAVDQNQLTMELMRKIALRHDLVCLLHEKPFMGVNGSGKHNNWSICTDTGLNLLDPGKTPAENAQFLVFLVAVIKAVDEYADLLRLSAATYSNDYRLGGNEAPPAILSMFLGEELESILHSIEIGSKYVGNKSSIELGVHVIPSFTKDTTDRNRTSPFAFTGNKFEFRSIGSSASIADANIVLNTAVAEALRQFADELEGAEDFDTTLNALIKRTIKEHKRIIFSGNGYSEEWKREAEKRGLPNYPRSVDVYPHFTDEKNVKLFSSHKIFTGAEMESRKEILLETYSKLVRIEAVTMIEMVKKDIIGAVVKYSGDVAAAEEAKRRVLGHNSLLETELLTKLSANSDKMYKALTSLQKAVSDAAEKRGSVDALTLARTYCDKVIPKMEELRKYVDTLEELVDRSYWPYPSYGDMMFRINPL